MEMPELVTCDRRPLRLTEAACARFWLSSNPVSPPVWEGRVACHGCPAGAARAGGTVDPFQAIRERLHPVCPRCRKAASRIINDRLCVSCYNRDAEVRRGYNRKGQPPVRTIARLTHARIVVVENGLASALADEKTFGPLELVLRSARRATAPLAFGWAPPAAAA
jgi:hypothetical protein